MKKISHVTKSILGLAIGAIITAPLFAAAPNFINYQGKLTDDSGVPISVPVNVTFKFYDAPSGGNQIGIDQPINVSPINGVFSTPISIPPNLFRDYPSVYLGVKVGNSNEFAQRQQLVAAPYALSVAAGTIGVSEIKSTSINVAGGLLVLDGLGKVQDTQLNDTVTKLGNVVNQPNKLVTVDANMKLPSNVIASSVAVNAVKTAQIEDLAVTNEKVAAGLDAGKITSGTLGDDRLSGTVTKLGNAVNVGDGLLKLETDGKIPALDGSLITKVQATGIGVGAVGTQQIADGAVTAEKLSNMSIPYAKLNLGGAIQSSDLSSPVYVYETNDGRLIIGNSYMSSLCLLSNGVATYYDCIYDDKGTTDDERVCDQSLPKACTAPAIVGHLVK